MSRGEEEGIESSSSSPQLASPQSRLQKQELLHRLPPPQVWQRGPSIPITMVVVANKHQHRLPGGAAASQSSAQEAQRSNLE